MRPVFYISLVSFTICKSISCTLHHDNRPLHRREFRSIVLSPRQNDDEKRHISDLQSNNTVKRRHVNNLPSLFQHPLTVRGGYTAAKSSTTTTSTTIISSSTTTVPENKRSKKNKRMEIYILCASVVAMWIITGTVFYALFNDWPYPQAFFYAIDAGMSIGFCTDVYETAILSKAFTILYILCGASVVAGSLGLITKDVLLEEGGVVDTAYFGEYKKMLEKNAFRRADKDGSGTLSYKEFHELLKEWEESNHHILHEKDKIIKTSSILSDEEKFNKFCQIFDQSGDGQIQYEEFISEGYSGIDRLLHHPERVLLLNSGNWIIRKVVRLQERLMSVFKRRNRVFLVFNCWILLGVLFGMFYQKWDVITALHFAISALATGGLTAPPVDKETGILHPIPSIFCGIFCLIGIPLFALTLGHFALVLVEKEIKEAEQRAICRPLVAQEFEFAKRLCSTDDVIHLQDFIVLQLLRQGKLRLDTVELIKKQFKSLDTDQSGFLSFQQATEEMAN